MATKKVKTKTVLIEDIKKEYPIELKYIDIDGQEKIGYMKNKLFIIEEQSMLSLAVHGIINDISGYSPMWKNFYFKHELIHYFTNIELPDSIKDSYKLIYETNLYNNIVNNINGDYIYQLENWYNDMIDFECKCYQNKSSFDFLCSDIRELVGNIGSKITQTDIKNIKRIISKFSKLNFNEDEVKKFIKDYLVKNKENNVIDLKM